MKKTFTLFAATLINVIAFANGSFTKLSIASLGDNNIRVMIDGRNFSTANNNNININNLTPGFHSVRILQEKRNGRRGGWFANSYEQIYNDRIYARPDYFIDIIISRFGKVYVDQQYFLDGVFGDDHHHDNDNHHGGWNGNNNNGGGYGNNNGNWNSNNRVMNQASFHQFKQTLLNESFENTRLTMAKQVIANNWFTTAMVKDLVEIFAFENNKLDLAKYAYAFTTDRNQYFQINDCFTFSNSKQELTRYIQNFR